MEMKAQTTPTGYALEIIYEEIGKAIECLHLTKQANKKNR